MYAAHFGLTREPFSIAPDPRFLYMSERHREALAHLLYGLRAGGGFVLLSGEIGAGKTTVCRCFLEKVPQTCNVAYVFNPKLTVVELLQTICQEFGIEVAGGAAATVRDHVDALNTFLLRMHGFGRTNVLVIDEAQNLSADVLEQLRLLTNLETNERKLLQIILIGQPELRELVAEPRMEQLAQRVIARYHLQALSEPETAQYVRHRLAVAGLKGPSPFDGAALRAIHRATRGVPRRINLLADRALLGAYAEGRPRADARTVRAAAREVFDGGARTAGYPRWWLGAGLAVGAAAVLALALGQAWRGPSSASSASPSPVAGPGAVAGPAAASAASSPPVAVAAGAAARPVVDAAAFAALEPWGDETEAWRALSRQWQIDVATGEPCAVLGTLGMACHRGHATLALLRQLDRPALLALRRADGRASWALLSGLGDGDARVVLPAGEVVVPLPVLAASWRGEFGTLWRTPPGYRGDGVLDAGGALASWLDDRLGTAQGDALPAGASRRQRIEAFQVAQGLKVDGLVGPLTLMQLNRAAGEPGPHLHTE